MRHLSIIVLTTLALGGSALAAEQHGASSKTPGHEMQDRGSKAGSPGASGYAPGHEMKSGGSEATGSTTRTGGSGTSGTTSSGTRR